jgi:hypothetical protein
MVRECAPSISFSRASLGCDGPPENAHISIFSRFPPIFSGGRQRQAIEVPARIAAGGGKFPLF